MIMSRNLKPLYPTLAFLPFLDNEDFVKNPVPENDQRTGWERVKQLYQLNEFGDTTREARSIYQIAMLSSFVGAVYGGVVTSRTAYTDFMSKNTASVFTSHFEAKRQLQDSVTKSFAKGAFRWSWRLTLFSTTFVGLTTTISAYRGKQGILEYVVAGVTTGAMYKFNMGPQGMLVGAGLGAVLGLISGTLTNGVLKLTGMSMEEVRERQQAFGDYRKKFWQESIKSQIDKEEQMIIDHSIKAAQDDKSKK